MRGLADVVERRGVKIFEQTAAAAIEPGRVLTDRGTVRAEVVVRATEAYTRDLRGRKRQLLPIYSLMIGTEPLPQSVFDEIGLADRPTFADDRYMVIYGQRTADDRIAFGGRGVPYLYGSRISPSVERHHRSHERIHQTLVDLVPALAGARITHRWGGVLGVTRNWTPFVHFDRAAGTAGAGGYVGEGVGTLEPGRAHLGRSDHRNRLRAGRPAVGRESATAAGSPSRCAGWGCGPAAGCWPAPTSTNTALTGKPRPRQP